MDQQIEILKINHGNLKNIDVQIPKNKLVVLTGVSGSGKTTLAKDVLFQECQRQYLEAMGMQGLQKPDILSLKNGSPAIMITQGGANRNPRSTVGTVTDIYTDLRMVFEKLHTTTCVHCGKLIQASKCKEVFEKTSPSEFVVSMFCSECGFKMPKLTRSHFSYNTQAGGCPTCQGLGVIKTINMEELFDPNRTLDEGAILYWDHAWLEYQTGILRKSFKYYGLHYDEHKLGKDLNEKERAILFYGTESEEVKQLFPDLKPPKSGNQGKFEGAITTLMRRQIDKGGTDKRHDHYFIEEKCYDCQGQRLNKRSREATVHGKTLYELFMMSLDEIYEYIFELEKELTDVEKTLVEIFLNDMKTKIRRICNVGLGYLSLDRQTMTLSGGESQRIKLSATLDCGLTGMIYILDEPTTGLHSKDTAGIIKIMKELRDLGNTVLVIEHDPDVMKEADHILDIGPYAGKNGGEIVGVGTLEQLMEQPNSLTGQYLKENQSQSINLQPRTPKDFIKILDAHKHNLNHQNVTIPTGCLVCITGVSGSGKSTLIFDILAQCNDDKVKEKYQIENTEFFDKIIEVEQAPAMRMSRSNVATYSGVYDEIRKLFEKESGLPAKMFSFNVAGGRCENCGGLGYVTTNMSFFDEIEVVCPVCGGKQFSEEVLKITYNDLNIHEVLQLDVDQAFEFFKENKKINKILSLLKEVGLGYLNLGQTLTTLSGGECQRLKLGKELLTNETKNVLYLIDEPTTGLHPIDVDNFLKLLKRLVDTGSSVIVVEHNLQLVSASDYIIDLGPEGGIYGGKIIAQGTPSQIKNDSNSVTGKYL